MIKNCPSCQPRPEETKNNSKIKEFFIIISVGLLIIVGFISLNELGFTELINVNQRSSLAAFFIFGLIAGFSSCMALVGGMVLSMSKQWSELYTKSDSLWKKFQPNLFFNVGRIASFVIFGAILGIIGMKLNFLLEIRPILVLAVSLIMIFLAFQMLGIKMFQKYHLATPKFITRYIANKSNFKGRFTPFFMGMLTFFFPCCFTITVQMLALISGNMFQAGLIMFFFALGTLPMLLSIGLFNIKFSQKPHLQDKFLKVAAILVLYFAFYNINFQLNLLGVNILEIFNF
jgi:sulfite exporter TauE/SafE